MDLIHELIREVAQSWGFVGGEIPWDKTRQAIGARLCCIVKLRALGLSLVSIGRTMNLDHTTIVHWINKIPDEMAQKIVNWDTNSRDETYEVLREVNHFLQQRKPGKASKEASK